jgi:hypothetical protein
VHTAKAASHRADTCDRLNLHRRELPFFDLRLGGLDQSLVARHEKIFTSPISLAEAGFLGRHPLTVVEVLFATFLVGDLNYSLSDDDDLVDNCSSQLLILGMLRFALQLNGHLDAEDRSNSFLVNEGCQLLGLLER